MIPIKPDPAMHLLPRGSHETTFLPPAGMANCSALEVIKTPQCIISTWQPTPGDLELLKLGVPVTLIIWGHGMPPVSLSVGGVEIK